uniref:Uncharacterized protein n=1 Tax=Tanacetum cinerariifolium TaxID=118510 RepID=A0A6L2LQ12_TANCI|nr:hypothetical protein [Tanacetum cinerariifolium]
MVFNIGIGVTQHGFRVLDSAIIVSILLQCELTLMLLFTFVSVLRYEETPSGLKPYRQKDGALLAIEYRLTDEELVREGVAQVNIRLTWKDTITNLNLSDIVDEQIFGTPS